MKIGLIVPANLKYSPYVKYYTDILKSEGVCFRTMVWDKAGKPEGADFTFSFPSSDFDRKRILLGHFLFSRQCKRFIRKEQIDRLIVFTIAPLYFLGYRFLKRFSGKMIMDIRDDSPFRRKFPKALDRAAALSDTVVVSSPFYSEWISTKSFLCHNADLSLIEKYTEPFPKDSFAKPVSIAYAGMMIEEQINIRAVEALANSKEFRLVFIGRDNEGKEKIRQYAEEHDIHNVSFIGEYKKEDIIDLYRNNADLVNILRENTQINRNALPNKLYEAVVSGIPLAVYEHNTAIANYVREYGLGILLNDREDLKSQLRQQISAFDYGKYQAGRKNFLQLVLNDYEAFRERIVRFAGKA